MSQLSNLKNTHRTSPNVQRVGRGVGSGRGKTSTRGHKGAKSRAGYKTRGWQEGGGVPLFKRLPTRGFNNARFANRYEVINLDDIEKYFLEGETVSLETLKAKRLLRGKSASKLKILGRGELKKKVEIHADAFTASALAQLDKSGHVYKSLQPEVARPKRFAKKSPEKIAEKIARKTEAKPAAHSVEKVVKKPVKKTAKKSDQEPSE